MSKLIVALSAVSLGSLAQPSPPLILKAAVPHSRPARLEGMDYVPARRAILGFGWVPAAGPCDGEQVDASECASFPEIDTCSPVWPAYCHMVFARANLCLDLTTSAGPPEAGQEESDTHILNVSFHRGSCWRAAFEALRRHDAGSNRRRAGQAR
jgi:hypothetical protein